MTGAINEADLATALRISPLIYDAVLTPERWPHVLGLLGSAFEALFVSLDVARPSTATIHATHSWASSAGHEMRSPAVEEAPADEMAAPKLPGRPNRSVRRSAAAGERHAPDPLGAVRRPAEIEGALSAIAADEAEDIAIGIKLFRARSAAPFARAEAARLQLYLPHLHQAARLIGRRLDAAMTEATLTRALDRVALATVVVDARGAIRFANACARGLLRTADAVRDEGGHLVAVDAAVRGTLQRRILGAASAAREADRSGTGHIVIPRTGGGLPLQATVRSLTPPSGGGGGGGAPVLPLVTVSLLDPARRIETSRDELQGVFGLTEAEAEILAAFVAGREPRAIAEASGRSYETVRFHMKNVMDKLGVGRQTELMRVALGAIRFD